MACQTVLAQIQLDIVWKPTGNECQGREVPQLLFTVGLTAVVKAGFKLGTNIRDKILQFKLENNTDLGFPKRDYCPTTFINKE